MDSLSMRDHVLWESDDGLAKAMYKPAGILTTGKHDRSLQSQVRKAFGISFSPAHCLDRHTSGVILIGGDRPTRGELCRQFRERKVVKWYLAVVEGLFPDQLIGNISPLKKGVETVRTTVSFEGKHAASSFSVLGHNDEQSLLAVRIYTGRTHQIRVHLAQLGFPIVGDPVYNKNAVWDSPQRMMLHAHRIHFPFKGDHISVEAPVGSEFSDFLANSHKLNSI
jgi:RluA family pseudouridine synthase